MKRAKTRLRELRQQRNLSLGQLALRVGVHRTHIHKIELGHRLPAVDVLVRLATYFGCPMEELIGVTIEDRAKK